MTAWIACGAFSNPKTSPYYFRFSSKAPHQTQEEAEAEIQEWDELYPFTWTEEIKTKG